MLDQANRAIGGLFVWHSRYRTESCVGFHGYIDQCLMPNSLADTRPFVGATSGTVYTPGQLASEDGTILRFADKGRAIDNTPAEQLFMLPLSVGIWRNFPLPMSRYLAMQYRADGWLNHAVKKVLIGFNVYNANIRRFGVVLFAFEFSPGGVVTSRRSIASAPVERSGNASRLVNAIVIILLIDSLFIFVRAMQQFVACHIKVHARAVAKWKDLKKRWQRVLKQRKLSLERSGTAGRLEDPPLLSTFSSWSSRIWSSDEGARQLRKAEVAASNPWWILVEMSACLLLWAYVLLLSETQNASLLASQAFDRVSQLEAQETNEASLESMVATIDITLAVFDVANLVSAAAYLGSIVAMLMLLRMFKVC